MSHRINEEIKFIPLFAPSSQTAGASLTAGEYVPVSGCREVEVIINAGSLASGKKVTVEVYDSEDSSGTGAKKIADGVIVGDGSSSYVLVIPVDITADVNNYMFVKIGNDSASAVGVSAVAACRKNYLPV